jgi:hypothetical protein
VLAQDPSGANRLAPLTRAGEVELARQQKAANLTPDAPDKIESTLIYIKEKRIVERITTGVGGVRVVFGGMIHRSGFALGPEFRRDMLDETVTFRASARGSLRRYYMLESGLDMPALAGGRLFLHIDAQRRGFPHVDYYGPGPESAKTGRSAFLLEDTSFQTTAGIRPVNRARLGVIGRYLLVNIGPSDDAEIGQAARIYSERTTPGLDIQSNFLESSAFAQYDWRDNPGGPRRGGNYLARYSIYSDIDQRRYSFNRAEFDVQQYFPFFNERRVIALRGHVVGTEARAGNRVPFYLQPTLGGSEELRGFRAFRFYDNSAVHLTAEYRWEVFSGLDMALFADAGNVFADWRDISFRTLKTAYGFGFRANARNVVFMRIDTGFSSEGFQVWFKFGNVF